jgi:hypothetical protein
VTKRAAERVRAARFLYFQDLARRLRALEADCSDPDAAGEVMREYRSLTRGSALFTEGDPEASSLDPLFQRVVERCARQALERCRAGEIKGGLDMRMIARQYGALELDPPYTDAEWKDLEKCPPIKLVIEDNNEVALEPPVGPGLVLMPGLWGKEKSRHVYDGFLYLDKDSLWKGGVTAKVEGSYSTIDGKTLKARAKAVLPGNVDEKTITLEQASRALGFLFSKIPTCNGTYLGRQFFTIEGSFTTGDQGQNQVELAFVPIEGKEPDFYKSTPECPWLDPQELEGVKVIPTRLVKGQETTIVIDPPQQGQPMKKYVIPVQAEGIRGETVIMVGGK